MKKESKILVTGCQGMGGWAIIRALHKYGYVNVVGVDRSDCDLLDQKSVFALFEKQAPEYVFHIAAKVGGVFSGDSKSGLFMYENILMQTHVIEAARVSNVEKLLFCGSASAYPEQTTQPIKEESLFTGELGESNKGYALAKLMGVAMVQMYREQYGCDFISVMPSNLYGIGDNFNLESSHVIPASIRKIHDAKITGISVIELNGDISVLRDFVYVDDFAEIALFLMGEYSEDAPVNVASGNSINIGYLISLIKNVVGYSGSIILNGNSKGVHSRDLDISKLDAFGVHAKTKIEDGIKIVYDWYLKNYTYLRK